MVASIATITITYFPPGTEVGVNAWVTHFDKDIWGPDANEFRPERWLEAEKGSEKLKTMEAHYMPVGLPYLLKFSALLI